MVVLYTPEQTQNFSGGPLMSAFIDVRVLNASTGVLSPIPGSPFATGYSTAGNIVLSPTGTYAYLLAQQFPSGTCCIGPTYILVYALDPTTGAPSLKQALATQASEASSIAMHPSGKFVYVNNYSANNTTSGGIGIFAVQNDGTLAFSQMAANTAQAQTSRNLVIDPNGNFLYANTDGAPVTPLGNNACGLFYSDVWAFSIDSANGALTPVSGSPFTFQRNICEVGHAPQWVTEEMDPSGQRLFLVDSGNATITVFAIDPSSGALTLLPGSTTEHSGPSFTAAAMDPKGSFLYAGGPVYSFTGFSLTVGTGALPLLPGMPVQITPTPTNDEGSLYMVVDPSGKFLIGNENDYTSAFSCCGPDQLVEFSIDPSTGALTQVVSATGTLVGSASGMAVGQR
jgi:6-phosphogluconolactonase